MHLYTYNLHIPTANILTSKYNFITLGHQHWRARQYKCHVEKPVPKTFSFIVTQW